MSSGSEPERALGRVLRIALGAAAVFTIGAAFFGRSYFLGALAGGLLAMLNFGAIAHLAERLGSDKPKPVSWLGVFGLLLRYVLLCIALFVIISVWHASVVALAIGFSAPVAAVFVECGLYAYRESSAERESRR